MSMDIRLISTHTFPNLNCMHYSIYIKTYNTGKWVLIKATNFKSTHYGLVLMNL